MFEFWINQKSAFYCSKQVCMLERNFASNRIGTLLVAVEVVVEVAVVAG